jgi:beta-glucuronidase
VRAQPGAAGAPAAVNVKVQVRNVTRDPQRARLSGTFGGLALRFGSVRLEPGRARTLRARQLAMPSPHLWSPADPYLYRVSISASASSKGRSAGVVGRYSLETGIRSISVGADGRLRLNGQAVNLRGVALHEDLPGKGPALTSADRLALLSSVKDVGATIIRAHYPLHPAMQELADRTGMLIWSEVPVYRMSTRYLESQAVRSAAVDTVRQDVLANENHPSVIVWSIGNELDAKLPSAIRTYIGQATAAVHALDRSRPVGMAFFGHPRFACRPGMEALDVLGVNDYFGWYGGDVSSRDGLSPYLDQMRACHPRQAMMVTEFGAEANRAGLVTEKGTYAFQQDFARFHLGVFAAKPWLSGAIYWTLREFVITPTWTGGNPKPTPPLHQKGLITYAGAPKPAYFDVQAIFRATPQFGLP